MDIDYKRFTIKVEKYPAKEGDIPLWITEGGVLDSLICRKIYKILLGNYESNLIKSFDTNSQTKIHEYIEHAKEVGFKKGIIPVEIDSRENRCYIYTFAGLRANSLLSTIFSLNYDIHSVRDTAYYCSFKFRENSNFDNISDTMSNVETILKTPDINSLIDEKTQKFVKNKFINFLPIEDNVNLKMELLYNPEDLLKVVKNNSVAQVGFTDFKYWGLGKIKSIDDSIEEKT